MAPEVFPEVESLDKWIDAYINYHFQESEHTSDSPLQGCDAAGGCFCC